ncbi:Thiopurine S-methyltransferase (TPMT) [Xenococcus sp. PCC 7305]|uniref:class I SAM-dependent methyltransferase n=1 Tax=Xenococcus sp. PCC 7305 TaxID=102125 RepID=UPI0002ABE179|nr:class I SAM-dependent methyltransferase [Xenococcus sp. PCC 7305]ELS02453.1 Thiopurine S-methyltransferase (TPMT) [Xenococcus sp. PCC 7305]
MFEQQPQELQQKVKSLATEAVQQENPAGWFEPLYKGAKGDSQLVPWAKDKAHPYLEDWLQNHQLPKEKPAALVIGCGLGDDAERLADVGYQVTAFDISATAIAWCQQRFPNSSVKYLVADLLALDASWSNSFDLVYECRNIQALPLKIRSQVINAIAPLLAPEGTLLVVTRHRDDHNTPPEGPPWALSDLELSWFQDLGLRETNRKTFLEGDRKIIKQLRIEYSS